MGKKSKLILFGYIYFTIIALICFYFKLHFVISTFLFILVPTMFLLYKKKEIWREVLLFSLSLGIPVGFYTQIIAERNFVWKYVPFLDFFQVKDIPLEALFWYPSWFALVVATYLYFFDGHKHVFAKGSLLKRHAKYFIFSTSLFIISCILVNMNAYYMVFPYAYLSLISPLVLLSIFIFIFQRHNHFLKVFLPTTLILFLPMLAYDLIGVYSNQWTFPGQYLFVMDFGIAQLPFEEFFIWLWLWPSSVIAYFEEFEGDFS